MLGGLSFANAVKCIEVFFKLRECHWIQGGHVCTSSGEGESLVVSGLMFDHSLTGGQSAWICVLVHSCLGGRLKEHRERLTCEVPELGSYFKLTISAGPSPCAADCLLKSAGSPTNAQSLIPGCSKLRLQPAQLVKHLTQNRNSTLPSDSSHCSSRWEGRQYQVLC